MLSREDFNRYVAIIMNAEANIDYCSVWDQNFLNDYKEKFRQYRLQTNVNDNQDRQFTRIEEYLREELGHEYSENEVLPDE